MFRDAPRLTISACGTAFYAAMIGKYWFEKLARLPVEADVASELRYRNPVYPKGGLCLYVSQSGETADTLAAMRDAKAAGQTVAAIVNVPESSIAREADVVWPTYAGPGDRRRFDQGLHLPARGARLACHRGRARAARSAWPKNSASAACCWKPRAIWCRC